MKQKIFIITFLVMFCSQLYGQNPTVRQSLEAKYSMVEYHNENNGWYLVGKQQEGTTLYGVYNSTGKQLAFGGTEYRIYKSCFSLKMIDVMKLQEHKKWEEECEKLRKEYERKNKEYTAQYLVSYQRYSKEADKIFEGNGNEYLKAFEYRQALSEVGNKAENELAAKGIYRPVSPTYPTEPESGYNWITYTFIQPQPYTEIDFEALKKDDGYTTFCSVKKNGLYGVADQNLKQIIPCQYNSNILSTRYRDCQLIKHNDLYGAINSEGKIIMKMVYKEISSSNGCLIASKDGKLFGLYDMSGQVIFPEVFTDLSFATKSDQTFSEFAKNYVETFVNEWQRRGEFEKTEIWRQRVTEQTRKQKILDLTKQAQSAYIKLYTQNLVDELALGKYDPDHETFLIESKIGGKMVVPVPIAKAQNFKTQFDGCKKMPTYFIQNDKVGVSKYEFYLSDAEKYMFNNQASLNYSLAQVEYSFDPITINTTDFSTGNSNSGKQTISTISLNVGNSDVDVDIPVCGIKNEKTFAVIFSNENYQNETKVEYANNDGWVFKEYCMKTLGIPTDNVHYRADATYNNIRYELNWLSQVAEAYHGEATFIIYYAGHGVPDEMTKEAYLLPVDAVGSDVSTGYSISELYKTLGELPAKNIYLFMDACFSGAQRGYGMLASARGVAIKSKSDVPQGNMVVFSASTGQETAYPYKEKKHGMFTYYLLKKLKESNGDVTLGELNEYITTNVTQKSIVVNKKSQTPTVVPSAAVVDSWKGIRLR